ncbi:WPP domain-interacting protein 1-like [Tripterygium wilfordii]|uniref:WPP domain-interacting protein 1-like n=1 Tax=Tripterygium wilfordii TaxID=458696 RepID=A0A7J7C2X5_TRIWF|nr:WPP domain-interacting protein 1-like [Tripterygium wilfordii]XP_038690764.1 WPP domain-interacting protein 1-like [Tripterygium wilfordii]KAF5728509.1 WPP domain-interacting protein 1-like [Tripterygium wilfordii]
MEFGSQSSALEPVEDNGVEVTTTETVSHGDDGNVRDIRSHVNEAEQLGTGGSFDGDRLSPPSDLPIGGVEPENALNSPRSGTNSPGGASPPTTKGHGLKKWRRIRRDVVKDANRANMDGSKVLKRGLPGFGNSSKPLNMTSVDIKQNSEGSVIPTNMLKNVNVHDGLAVHGSSMDSMLIVGSTFTAGTDSGNSEDRSSKSSTAASAPRGRYELPAMLGFAREKNKMKNLSGKGSGTSPQRGQQGKGRVESSKKHRGERIKIEKENSHSSMESDSRSSNFVFTQVAYSVTSNGMQSRSMNYDGENSDEASEPLFREEVHTGYNKKNVEDVDLLPDDVAAGSSWADKGEDGENHRPGTDQDPLVESINGLQSVQEALENEIRKFVEIGNYSSIPLESTIIDPDVRESSSHDQFNTVKMRQSASSSLETQIVSLTQTVNYLENKLDETKAMLEVKESRVAQLEVILKSSEFPAEPLGSTILLQQQREGETELEGLLKQMIEAEIEYLAITSAIKKLRVAAGDPLMLFEKQETLAGEQAQMLNKLEEAESKATMLKKQAEELEKSCEDIRGTEKVLDMQMRVCKVSSCFLLQLMLLLVAFWVLVLRLAPHSGSALPT